MIFSRFALTSVALAVCHVAVAQVTQAAPAAPAAPSTNIVTESSGAVAPASGKTASSAPATGKAGTSDAVPTHTEPRLLRGDDRVVASPKAVPPIEGAPVSFNFEEAPVAEVVRTILGDILKADYVLHPPLSGTVTLATRAPIPPDQAVFLLESALQANGLALLRDARGSYHVGRPDALKGIGGAVRQAGNGPLPPGYGAIVVPLQYIGAGEMAAILKPMVQPDAIIRVDTVRNLLVLAGTRTQAEGWMELINMFDVNLLKGMSVGVFPLKYASIKEVEAALRLVGGGGAAAQGGFPAATSAVVPAVTPSSAGAASGGASSAAATAVLGEGNPLFGALRIMPIERLNSILVVTPRAAYLEEARRWIEKLDQPSENGAEPQLYIYQVQNGNARHLASVLNGIFGGTQTTGTPVANSGVAPGLLGSTGASGGGYPVGGGVLGLFGNSGTTGTVSSGLGVRAGGFSGGFAGASTLGRTTAQQGAMATGQQIVGTTIGSIRVMADELNNSVLVWGTRAEYAKIEATLKRLDLPPTQVLIEASIVEVTLNDDLKYGLQWAFNDSRTTTGYTGSGMLSSNTSTAGAFASALGGFSYTLRNTAGNVRAILNALSAKTSVKVVASPSLMVLDNHMASIAVGTQTPIQSGTTSNLEGTVTTTNIQYKDTGVNLMVTPSVNSGNIVTMQVDQSVTDVGAADDVTKQRAFLQRQLSSKVAVRSGESIVMGGLIQERGTTSKSGVPLLHTLPVVGNLFGSTSVDGARTELIVVITPRVVRSDVDIREVSEDLRDRMKGLLRVEALERGTKQQEPSVSPPLQPASPR